MRTVIHTEEFGDDVLSVIEINPEGSPEVSVFDYEIRRRLSGTKLTGPYVDGTRSFNSAREALRAGRARLQAQEAAKA